MGLGEEGVFTMVQHLRGVDDREQSLQSVVEHRPRPVQGSLTFASYKFGFHDNCQRLDPGVVKTLTDHEVFLSGCSDEVVRVSGIPDTLSRTKVELSNGIGVKGKGEHIYDKVFSFVKKSYINYIVQRVNF